MALSGHQFTVGRTPSHLPWAADCAFESFTNCTLPGIDAELLLTVAKLLNFTFTIVILEKPANFSKQLTWDETFGYYLQHGEIDFTMNSLAINNERLNAMGVVFGPALIYTDRGFMMRQPMRDLRYLLTQPFDSTVWMCMAGTVLLLTVLCAAVWSKIFLRESCKFGCSENFSLKTFLSSFWTVGMITLQQSLPGSYFIQKRPYTQKILIAVWIGASFVLASSYGAMLISVLLDIRPDLLPFTNLDELALLITNRGYRLIVTQQELGHFWAWIEVLETHPLFRNYITSVQRYPPITVGTIDDLIDRILADPYLIYPCRLTEVEYLLSNIRCNVTFVRSWEEAIATSPGFRKDFPYIETFSRAFLTLRSAVFDNILQRYLGSPICDPKSTDMSLSVQQLQGGFILLVAGAILGAALFCFEALVKLFAKKLKSESWSFSSAETAPASANDRRLSEQFSDVRNHIHQRVKKTL